MIYRGDILGISFIRDTLPLLLIINTSPFIEGRWIDADYQVPDSMSFTVNESMLKNLTLYSDMFRNSF